MNNEQAQLEYPGAAILGEGPIWCEQWNALLWIDIKDQKLFRYQPSKRQNSQVCSFNQSIGAVTPTKSGKLLVALKNQLYKFEPRDKQLEEFCQSFEFSEDIRFNDGKADPYGNFLVGTLHLKGEDNQAALYAIDKHGTVKMLLKDLSLSNGLTWSADKKTFYYIDTPTKTVKAYDYDEQNIALSNPRVVVTFADDEGWPDGMTIDEKGMLWIAHWDGSCVSRWDPDNQEQLMKIDLPCANVTSVCFGDDDYKTLYITTAREGLTNEQLQTQPLAGSIFKWRSPVAGLPTNLFED